MIITTEDAREYFKPLTYEDVTEKNFNLLVAVLEEVLGKWNRQVLEYRIEHGHDNRYYMTVHEHKKFSKYPGTRYVTKDGMFHEAFIVVTCDNYSKRSGISFNSDGWIGFAGWSDSDNVRPFIDAFEIWVDKLKRQKGMLVLRDTTPYQLQQINSYYVKTFPENAEIGRIVNKDGTEYIYTTDKRWSTLDTTWSKLNKVKDYVKSMKDSVVKTELLKILI